MVTVPLSQPSTTTSFTYPTPWLSTISSSASMKSATTTKKPRKTTPGQRNNPKYITHFSILALMLTQNLGLFANRSGVWWILKAPSLTLQSSGSRCSLQLRDTWFVFLSTIQTCTKTCWFQEYDRKVHAVVSNSVLVTIPWHLPVYYRAGMEKTNQIYSSESLRILVPCQNTQTLGSPLGHTIFHIFISESPYFCNGFTIL